MSRSIAEVKYRSMCSTACELRWIQYLLEDFKIPARLPIQLHCDNEAALAIARNPVFHEHTKHIEIDIHIVRDMVAKGFLDVMSISSKLQPADLFTKSLPACKMKPALTKLNFLNSHNDIHCEERGC